ncbi:MAG: Gfo/Idh/MocA family oxidoreductase [Clostridia bacterium]|nr:Gfo/Idh/MocA family oxidoreductase [Clostridia bacterium]
MAKKIDVVRMGIIGIGNQGSNYANLITGKSLRPRPPVPEHLKSMFPDGPQVPGMVLGAICEIDPEKIELAKKVYPEVPIYTDWKEMITSGDVDAVVTTVPHYLHPEIVIYAMEHGIHAMSDKPAGVYAKQVREMNECAARHPELTFGMMFNQRTNPLYIKIREIVQSGELGKIRRANWIITTWYRNQAYYNSSSWRATWGGEGGGVLVNQAPHQIDLMQWICGMPKKVYAKCINGYQRDIVTEDEVTAMFDYGDGATGAFITCTHDYLGTDRFEILLDGGKIVVENSRRAIVQRLPKPEQEINKEGRGLMGAPSAMGTKSKAEEEVIEYGRDGQPTQHTKVLIDFAANIINGSPLVAPGADGINGVQIANAIQLSGWLGKEVEVPVCEQQYLDELNKRIIAEGKYEPRS